MNGGFGGESSSGCESGWTMYLDHSSSSVSLNSCHKNQFGEENNVAKEEEEEDLSMVSDASSGPQHFHEHGDYCNENGCFCSSAPSSVPTTTTLMKKSIKRQKIQQKQSSMLDDTASSPLLIIPKKSFTATKKQASMDNDLDNFSQGFLQTHFKERSELEKSYGLLKSTVPRNQTSTEPEISRKQSGNELW